MNDVIYLSHGGGPLPFLDKEGHKNMIDYYQSYSKGKTPKAIIVISAHYETEEIEVIYDHPEELLFDYYGFPNETYEYKYNPPINKEYGEEVYNVLKENKLSPRKSVRGFDHGVFIPLMIMYQNANIPVIQISLKKGLDPETHIKVGEALSKLDGYLIIGSGSSYHNLRNYISKNPADIQMNNEFHDSLKGIMTTNIIETDRREKLINWKDIPFAKTIHPREEHLIPLLVCYGVKNTKGKVLFDDQIFGKRNICVEW